MNAWAKNYLGQLESLGWSTFDPRHPRELDSPLATAMKGARYLTLSSTTGPAMKFRTAVGIDLEKRELVSLPVGRPSDTRADATNTVLISHETRYTGHQILRLFELNQDAWSDMIPHLSNRERRLLQGELDGTTNPALQELAGLLAQD